MVFRATPSSTRFPSARRLAALAAVACSLSVGAGAARAMILINFGTPIIGDSLVQGFKGYVAAEACSVAVSTPESASLLADRPKIDEIVITKSFDVASTSLVKQWASGGPIPQVQIYFVSSGGASIESPASGVYEIVTLKNVIISGYRQGGGEDERPTETLMLSAQAINVQYISYNPNGTLAKVVQGGYDQGTKSAFSVTTYDPSKQTGLIP